MGGGKEGEYRKKAWEKGERRRRSTLRKYATEMGGRQLGEKDFGGKEEFWVVERRGVANRHCLRKSRQKNHYFAFIVRHSAANVS